jgi:hypothetical protein
VTGDKDRVVDGVLKRRGWEAVAAEPCPDAETIAAWVDGGLEGEAASRAEAHLSACARCQAILAAVVEHAPAPAVVVPAWRRWQLGWLVPLTAATAAVVLWVVAPRERITPAETPVEMARQDASVPQPPVAQPLVVQPSSPSPAAAPSVSAPAPAVNTLAEGTSLERPKVETESAAPAPSAPAEARDAAVGADAQSAARMARAEPLALGAALASPGLVIASPGEGVRWRVTAPGVVELSVDRGATWNAQQTGVSGVLLAGSAPQDDVCWLVGRGGVVVRTADRRTWQRVAFPEPVDLTAVHAEDARAATVTAADGRTWQTTDGGGTWTSLPQGF